MANSVFRIFLSAAILLTIWWKEVSCSVQRRSSTLEKAEEFLDDYTEEAQVVFSGYAFASWEYNTNITDYNAQQETAASVEAAAFSSEAAQNASRFQEDASQYPEEVQRQLNIVGDIGIAALNNDTEVEEYNEILTAMMSQYSTGQICREDNQQQCYFLEPGLADIMATSTDWDELVWAWQGFRDKVGIPNKPYYIRYVELGNKAARANGYSDKGEEWRANYESDTLVEDAYALYNDILPLYKQLHAYVRRNLNKVYGDTNIDVKGMLPANVLGDMWGRFWGNIYNLVVPFPDRPDIDVTDAMIEQDYDADRMFRLSDDFFASLGLFRAPQPFWNGSMMTKPTDGRNVVCHASAWDFSNQIDFRIKMCTEVTMEHLLTIHHEMGHIQYYIQYKELPIPFRGGANEAFHEAVGEVMTLSVATPTHLNAIGLLDAEDLNSDEETDINFLLKMSLDTIGTLPFSLALEQWRWDVFSGDVSVDHWMERWWKLKEDMIGVKAPVTRTEKDFDPGAMFHIVGDYSFLRYYIRTIIQFQFHEAMCNEAGFTGPLHKCDIYNSTAAGDVLANMLQMGYSRPWPEAMEAITGQPDMKSDAILKYFDPLMNWLEKVNAENDEVIGWTGGAASLQSFSILSLAVVSLIPSFISSTI